MPLSLDEMNAKMQEYMNDPEKNSKLQYFQPNNTAPGSQNFLFVALGYEDWDFAKALVELRKEDVSLQFGQIECLTPLFMTLENLDMTRFLLHNGASAKQTVCNTTDGGRISALDHVCGQPGDRVDIATELVLAGCKICTQVFVEQGQPLYNSAEIAFGSFNFKIMKFLMSRGCTISHCHSVFKQNGKCLCVYSRSDYAYCSE